MNRLALRQIRRGTLVIVAVTAGMSALVAAQYQSTFTGTLNGPALQALAANPAIRTLFGPPVALDDPGGFTVWRTGTVVAILIGVWALLAATRITRGEEDTGRWDLLLSGRLRATEVVVRHLIVLAAAIALVGTGVTVALLATGTDTTGAVLHGAGIAGVGWFFAAVGSLSAQVFPARSAATGAAVAALGALQLARMVTDGLDAPAWVQWLTPFGLLSQMSPYSADRWSPLLALVGVPILLGAAAAVAARRRDIGGALLRTATSRRPRTRLLRSLTGFAVRRSIRPFTGWLLGVGAYFLLIGMLTTSITRFLADNARFAELAAAAGFGGLGSPSGFAAAMFAVLAIPAGVYPAVRLAAFGADEVSRRSVSLFGLPVSRHRVLGADLVAAAAGMVLLLVGAGLAGWAGAAAVGAPLHASGAVLGALNVAPVGVLCLGAATFALGWAPHAVGLIGVLPAVGGFFLQVIALSAGAPGWVLRLSPFTHIAAVPDAAWDGAGAAGLLAVAAILGALGVAGYRRRDLLFS